MKLRDLEAEFVRLDVRIEPRTLLKPGIDPLRGMWTDADFHEVIGPVEYHVVVPTLAEADGIYFLCPKCWNEPPVGRPGTHGVVCWFVGKVPDDVSPKPGRWTPSGTGLDDLTFVPSAGRSQSVLLLEGCCWHGFVTSGDAT